jgi:septum formation topological specificity factor MinE
LDEKVFSEINFKNRKKVLINTDRAVESRIIKDYFENKKEEFEVVHKYFLKNTPSDYYL